MREQIRLERVSGQRDHRGSEAEPLARPQKDQDAEHQAKGDRHEPGDIEQPVRIVLDIQESVGKPIRLPQPLARLDLVGRKVGVSRIGSESHNAAVWMLSQNGADVRKVTFIQTGSTIVSMTGLQQNSLDAAVLSPPFTGEMIVQGFKALAKTSDVAESPFNGMVTSQENLRRRPERIRKSLKALLESYRRIKQDRPVRSITSARASR